MDLSYFFQMSKKLLLLLISLLYFIVLLFKHLGVILRNVRENGGKHGDIEEKVKTFLFCLYIVDLGTITGFFK